MCDAEVVDLEAGALEHHPHEVLPDVVDVALDRADDHGADGLGAGFGQQGAEQGHAGLHGVGCQEDLGHEEDAVSEVDADDAHALDKGIVEDLVGTPAAVEQDLGAFRDLVGQAVVEVVVHLGTEVLVVQGVEVDLFVEFFFVSHTRTSFVKARAAPDGARCTGGVYRPSVFCIAEQYRIPEPEARSTCTLRFRCPTGLLPSASGP